MTSTPTYEALRSDERHLCLRHGALDDRGVPAQSRRAAQDRRLLAGQPLSLPGDDLPEGQPAAARAADPGAHEAAAARPLGFGRRPELYLHPFQPADQEVRPERDLHLRPRARGAGGPVPGLPRGDLFRDLSGQERGRSRDCSASSSSSPSPAASAATPRRKRPAASTRAASSATASRTPTGRPSTTRT